MQQTLKIEIEQTDAMMKSEKGAASTERFMIPVNITSNSPALNEFLSPLKALVSDRTDYWTLLELEGFLSHEYGPMKAEMFFAQIDSWAKSVRDQALEAAKAEFGVHGGEKRIICL